MAIINSQQWDAALAALKPSKRDLEYGLGLHRESIVVEPYGFSPLSEVPIPYIRQIVESNASSLEIQRYRSEMRVINYLLDPVEWEEYKAAFDQSGITCIIQNAGQEIQDPLVILERLARYSFVADVKSAFVFKAVVPEDIERAKREKRHCLYMMTNGVPLLQRWNSPEEELHLLKLFFMLGVRMMHLTYNRRNMLGDGCGEPANAGLSDFGKMAVREMNRIGIIVDIAHSGEQTGFDAVKASSRPVVASHSACASLNKHCRCKSDRLIKALAESGGYIGICAIQKFIGGNGGINDVLDHIDYAARKFGPNHVAIGTDVGHLSKLKEKNKGTYPAMQKTRPGWEKLWPEYNLPQSVLKKFEKSAPTLSWTNWPLFTVGLVQRGYSDSDIKKIIGGNVLRTAKEVIKNSAFLPEKVERYRRG
ncbi:MAG TPA: membrane dipeptidase [bacterium]|nr:membrane dipeptidase [bacterium]